MMTQEEINSAVEGIMALRPHNEKAQDSKRKSMSIEIDHKLDELRMESGDPELLGINLTKAPQTSMTEEQKRTIRKCKNAYDAVVNNVKRAR